MVENKSYTGKIELGTQNGKLKSLDKIGYLLGPYNNEGMSHVARHTRNNVTMIENHQLAINKRMIILRDRNDN